MKKLFQALAFSLSIALPTTSNAVLIEFDTSGLLMDDVFGGTGLYAPTGTFLFDTDTLLVSDVDVATQNAIYVTGDYDPAFEAFGLFTTSGVDGLVLDITIDFTELELTIASLDVGDLFFIGADPYEFDNSNGDEYGFAIDPTLIGTIIDPVVVPVPASMPLLLAGLGGLSLAMRRKRKAVA